MRSAREGFSSSWVSKLIIINVIIFCMQLIYAGENGFSFIERYFSLLPARILGNHEYWRIFTYMFLHDSTGWVHIFFNMLMLLMFGKPVEEVWGGRKFLLYYLYCGIGAGITIFLISWLTGSGMITITIGASGAVMGIMLAFGMIFPEEELMIFPLPFFIKAKYLVPFVIVISLLLELFNVQTNVSNVGHIGGAVFGLVYFLFLKKRRITYKAKSAAAIFRKELEEKGLAEKLGEIIPELRENKKEADSDMMRKKAILKKLKDNGPDAIDDDEYQFIKFIEILTDENPGLKGKKIDVNDYQESDLEISNEVFLQEVKKYFKTGHED